jgi:hypothetical protein
MGLWSNSGYCSNLSAGFEGDPAGSGRRPYATVPLADKIFLLNNMQRRLHPHGESIESSR